ncbi:MAG: DNA translocase FtsK 4TM domain-containing protein [Oleiphilaceae bacterium]|nr:DNA translocase FtsK 4TM domain-containing protein [Oleiphilaceae bacterium]
MAEPKKAVSAPQLSEKQQRFRRLLAQFAREGTVIGLVALCIYLGMALITFSAGDPGWASIGHDTHVSNHAGRTGAWVASLLRDFFGQVAFLFPVMIAGYALMLFRLRHEPMDVHWPLLLVRFGGFVLILASATALLSLYSLLGLASSSGGVLGVAISDAMVRLFNLPATTVLLMANFLFALTVTLGLSWFNLMDRVGGLTLRLLGASRRALKAPFVRHSMAARDKEAPASAKPATLTKPEKPPRAEKTKSAGAEPPIVNNRVSEPLGHRPWWKRMLGIGRKKEELSPPRVEPALDGLMGQVSDPGQVESFSSREGADTDYTESLSAEPKPSKAKGGSPKADTAATTGKSLKISPFKRNEEPASARGEKQPSLFDSIESSIPPISLLDPPDERQERGYSEEALENMSRLLETKLADFGVSVEVVEVNPGPVITRFEIKPAAGVKVSRISNLAKDLARSLAVLSVRVVEVIPGKSVVGIEIPNEEREMVRLSEVLGARVFTESSSPLTLALGNDIGGNPMVANLSKMPHLLVAGTTGSGKSVGVNAMILSMLLKATPEEVRFIMVDPKMLELSIYDGIPHLLAPVVTDMKEAANALRWCVAEMERRYKLLANLGVRNVASFNRKVKDAREAGEPLLDPIWKPDEYLDNDEQSRPELDTLPFIVVVIDEFADMMMIVGKKVEELIARIAQKARAAGIHLILATQRPSVDVITGLIKANIPTRMSFQVSSKIDSRTVLDQGGAEQLLGHGDMLYLPPGSGLPVRVHGAFVDDDEVHRVVNAWKERGEPVYVDDVLNGAEGENLPGVPNLSGGGDSESDSLFDEAVAFVTEGRRVSISSVQRKFKIGYNRAANLVEAMEASGVVSSAGNNGAREVLAAPPPRD